MEEYTPFMKQKGRYRSPPRRAIFCTLCLLLSLLLTVAFLAAGMGLLAGLLIHFGDHNTGRAISLQDILNSSFQAERFSGRFTAGDEILSLSKEGLELYNIAANTTSLLFNQSVWEGLQAESWSLSPSGSYLLLAHSTQKLYRHSFTADFSLLQISSGLNYSIPGGQWRVAQWTHSDSLILANTTGMYYIADVTPSNVGDLALLRASVGGELVGYPDWVYEEEILSSGSAVWASEAASPVLAYLVSNTSGVPEVTITKYGADTGAYPSYHHIPYPKAGDTESSIQLWLIQTANSTSCQIAIPEEYHYVQSVQWSNTSHLAVRLLNRQQTEISLVLYNTTCHLISYLHTYTTEGWIESTDLQSLFLPTGDAVSLLPQDGYTQVAIISSDSSVTLLTSDHEVRSLLAVYNSQFAFYTTGNYSYETHLYAVSLTDSSPVVCVSCQLSDQLTETQVANRKCKVVSAVFSLTARYFVLTCHGPDTPFSLLLDSSSLSVLKVLETNSALEQTLSGVALPTIHPFEFQSDTYTFYGTRMTPVDFSQSGSYPVLLYVYGGPNSQLASLSHPLSPFSGFIAYLVSSLGFVVITMEGRGTCCRGQDFRFLVKHKLGVQEAEDQTLLSMHLLSQSWVSSVSIMGASYGAYLSGMTASEDSASLAAAVVISPVTDWRYYDSVYTQRYMGTPQANPLGYQNSSLVRRSDGLAGSKLLLIHGAADDNVHYQNSAELSLALKKEGQQFRMHTYFDENHHLSREGTRQHLYTLIEKFIAETSL